MRNSLCLCLPTVCSFGSGGRPKQRKWPPLKSIVTWDNTPKQKPLIFAVASNIKVCNYDQTQTIPMPQFSHFGTMLDCVAKQMGVPEGQFSPSWPLSVWFSIHQCVWSLQSPTSPACLFHKAYVASLSHPCHCLSLTTHITPSCHFVQDADGSVCVVGCV